MRKETCFLSLEGNGTECGQPMSRPQTFTVCCCSMGAAWGNDCQACPVAGTPEYKAACGSGTPGMMVDPITGAQFEIDECTMLAGVCGNQGTCINTVNRCNHTSISNNSKKIQRRKNETTTGGFGFFSNLRLRVFRLRLLCA